MHIVHRLPQRLLAVLLAPIATSVVAQPTASVLQQQAATSQHVDVREVCRHIDQQLQDLLARVVSTDGPGVVDVGFDVEGHQVRNVRTHSGLPAHRTATRRAVHRLDCRSADPGRQALRLQVEFLDVESATPQERQAGTAGLRR
jgi:hypothetical protein